MKAINGNKLCNDYINDEMIFTKMKAGLMWSVSP